MKVGDLIRVKKGAHQEGMPDHRVAVIIEKAPTLRSEALGASRAEDIMQVLFLGQTRPLNFHVMFLEHFTTS